MTENTDTTPQSRRTYLKGLGVVGAVGVTGLAGCSGSASAATGTLATQVTDQPGDIADFESCIVTMEGIWVKPSDGDDEDGSETTEDDGEETNTTSDGETQQQEEDIDQSDEREYYQFDEPQEADLVQLQDGNTQLVDERELEVGTYEYLQLDVTGVEGTLEGGEEADVSTPGNAPLQFKEEFEIREEETTTFLGDFTPVKRGQTNRYLLQPVASGTEVRYGSE